MNVTLESTCQTGLGKKIVSWKKNFYVSSFIVSVWQKYLNKYEHLNKDSFPAKNLSALSLLWAFFNNVGLQTRACYNLYEPPHPASTAGLPQRKEFESMPTRVSSSFNYLRLSSFLLKKKSSSKTWRVNAFKISKCTEPRERNIPNIKTCGLEACGPSGCVAGMAQTTAGLDSPSPPKPHPPFPHR